MREDRAGATDYWNYTLLNPANAFMFTSVGERAEYWLTHSGNGWLYQNEVYKCRTIQDKILPLVDSAAQRVDASQFLRNRKLFGSSDWEQPFNPYTCIAKVVMPVYFSVLQKNAQAQTWLNQAIIACAIERYRIAHNALPATLEDLQMPDLPHDIITGAPLHYKVTGNDYILYSVGWNQAEDGGKPGKAESGSLDPMQGDWVWSLKPL